MKTYTVIVAILLVLFPSAVQAAISFVGSAENSSSPNTDTTVSLAGISLQQGDIVIVAAGIGDNDNVDLNMTMVTLGYTEVVDIHAEDTQEADLGVWWKIMGATPDTSVVVDGLGGTDASLAVVVMAFRGVDQSTPMDVVPSTVTGGNTMHANPPSINHNNPSGVWTVIAGASGHTLAGAGTYTFPTGYTTNKLEIGHDDTSDVTVGMGYRSSGISDPEDPGIMTHSGTDSANFAWAAASLALRPSPTNSAPTLSISEPTGDLNIIGAGDPYNITYSLSDSDDTVTAAFYYDTDNTGLDGVAITGACAAAAEGSGVTCTWDTTGVGEGSYYVYGITNDGTNSQVSAYSPGTVSFLATAASTPTVTTASASGVAVGAATLNGEVTDTGGSNLTARGFAWGTSSTLSGSDTSTTTESGSFGTGTFSENLSNLISGRTYYFRAYATNSTGTGYGSIQNFTTGSDGTPNRVMRLFSGYRIKVLNGRMIINQK